MFTNISKMYMCGLILSAAMSGSSLSAFGNCPDFEYHDAGNHRCLYGTCNGKCEKGTKPNLDARVGICMYCEPGYIFKSETRKCEIDNTPPSGPYSQDCKDISYSPNTDVLSASCRDKQGTFTESSLRDARSCSGHIIVGVNGFLECGTSKN